MHRKDKLCLSVYVDDLKMARKSGSVPVMWAKLMKLMNLEPPKKIVDNQYLGQAQREIEPMEADVERMGKAFEKFSVKKGEASARVAHPELRQDGQEILEAKAKGEDSSKKVNLDEDLGLGNTKLRDKSFLDKSTNGLKSKLSTGNTVPQMLEEKRIHMQTHMPSPAQRRVKVMFVYRQVLN